MNMHKDDMRTSGATHTADALGRSSTARDTILLGCLDGSRDTAIDGTTQTQFFLTGFYERRGNLVWTRPRSVLG